VADVVPLAAGTAADPVRLARTEWRRGQIVEAATRLLERHGFHGMSMQALAKEAGVSVGLIYQYVPNKDDVLLLVIVDILDAYKRELPPAIAAHTDPVEQLAAAFDAYCRVIDGRRAATVLAYRETATLAEAGRTHLKLLEVETTRLVAEVIERGIEEGAFVAEADADLVAFDLVVLAHAWALKHWYLQPRLTLDGYIARQLALVLRSLLVPRRRARYHRYLEAETTGAPE
jgi:AcrR family transcriptional regulator